MGIFFLCADTMIKSRLAEPKKHKLHVQLGSSMICVTGKGMRGNVVVPVGELPE